MTSITRNAYISLKKYLGLEVEDVKIFDYVQQLPYLDEKLLERLAVDVRMVATNYLSSEHQEEILLFRQLIMFKLIHQ
ncbi:MAG: hypothetical protein ACYDIA_11000 [Candidatus Humimicrobiaceae bacterium]